VARDVDLVTLVANELTEAMITVAMAKADARVCVGSDRCYAFPDRLEDARQSCTPSRWNASDQRR
jgi:hypothetical protein